MEKSKDAPLYGPHDPDMDIHDFLECTFKRVAVDEQEQEQFATFIMHLRKDCKACDVGGLMELSLNQIIGAAEAAVGVTAARGTARILLKFLGSRGSPHQPPNATLSEGMQSFRMAADAQVLFGRPGKGAKDSMECNFPDAMRPSSRAAAISGQPVKFPAHLAQYFKEKARPYHEGYPMPKEVCSLIAWEAADWVVSTFGISPVKRPCSPALASSQTRTTRTVAHCQPTHQQVQV